MAYHSFNKKYNLVIIGRCMLVCYPTENFWLISKYLTHITRHVEVNLITSTQYCCVCVWGIFCALRGPLKRLRRRHSNRSIVQGATTCVFRISRKKKNKIAKMLSLESGKISCIFCCCIPGPRCPQLLVFDVYWHISQPGGVTVRKIPNVAGARALRGGNVFLDQPKCS